MDKPWTVSHGPIAETENDLLKAEAINTLLVRPIGILPTASGDSIRPFAVGLFEEIRAFLKPDIAATKLRRAVGAFVHSKRYYFAQPDSVRHDIDGRPIELLSPTDRLAAQHSFLSLKRKQGQTTSPAAEPAFIQTPATKAEQTRAALLTRSRPLQRAAG